MEANRQLATDGENVDVAEIKAVMIEKMRACLKQLTPEGQDLITDLFFKGKSEQQLHFHI